MEKILEVKDLCKTYIVNKIQNNVLKNINFSIEKGELVSVMGPSGSGKSKSISPAESSTPVMALPMLIMPKIKAMEISVRNGSKVMSVCSCTVALLSNACCRKES
jgi:ABC-type microcin C transport system duplicated ATPase subunit YejF